MRYRETATDDDGAEWDLTSQIRVEAVEALARSDDPTVVGDLADALDDPMPSVRLAAVDAIAAVGMPVGVEQLVECAIDGDGGNDELAGRALEVLTSWRVEGVAELLAERLLDRDEEPLDDDHRDALDGLLEADPRGAAARGAVAERIVASLEGNRDADSEARGAQILRWLGAPGVDSVLAALADGRVQPALVRAAGRLGDARAIDPIVRGLGNRDPAVREAAATAAEALNHTGAVPALLAATQDAEQPVRDAASAALNRMGTAAVIAGLAALARLDGVAATSGEVLTSRFAEVLTATVPAALSPGSSEAQTSPLPRQPTEGGPAVTPRDGVAAGRRRSGGLVDRLLGRRD